MERNTYLDNTKFILMMLIVIGHCIEYTIGFNPVARTLYIFIYSFHIPLFAMISGYFSSSELTANNFKKNVVGLLIPYILFQTLFSAMIVAGSGFTNTHFEYLTPHKVYWYLLSLFTWRMMLPLFSRIDFRISIVLAVLIAILCGLVEPIDRFLSLSRSFVFFPFFLLGFLIKSKGKTSILASFSKPVAIGVLICALFISYMLRNLEVHWLYADMPYKQLLAESYLKGLLIRFSIMAVALPMGLSVLALIPQKATFYSTLGKRTLYIFLLHFIPIRIMEFLHIFTKIPGTFLPVVIFSLFGIMLTFILSWNRIIFLFRPFVEPIVFVKKISKP